MLLSTMSRGPRLLPKLLQVNKAVKHQSRCRIVHRNIVKEMIWIFIVLLMFHCIAVEETCQVYWCFSEKGYNCSFGQKMAISLKVVSNNHVFRGADMACLHVCKTGSKNSRMPSKKVQPFSFTITYSYSIAIFKRLMI